MPGGNKTCKKLNELSDNSINTLVVGTHASALPEKTKLEMGLTETLIRLSVGIEDFDDLKLDLSNALNN